jgi:hypothetical protein
VIANLLLPKNLYPSSFQLAQSLYALRRIAMT